MQIKATLKPNLKVGNGNSFYTGDLNVEVIDYECHPIYGPRFKVLGYNDWFEVSAFENKPNILELINSHNFVKGDD